MASHYNYAVHALAHERRVRVDRHTTVQRQRRRHGRARGPLVVRFVECVHYVGGVCAVLPAEHVRSAVSVHTDSDRFSVRDLGEIVLESI